ncbi:antigen 5 like allergen Cul n 1-like [Musca vetustissima]|uniref:antigen 5 like allergen Cul n 1-like n=1 Tax=Musca vetustissima TaxID=27455 RepID=UPI002AB6EF5B|nr:antigen 5 like allergen Cul n 1-like [Musca vetustissima]
MECDKELAEMASYNVLQCKMTHDKCHNTETFIYSGQNLAWSSYYGKPNATKLFRIAFAQWYNEYKDVKMDNIDSFRSSYSRPKIDHFTVMVADRNIRVGCAAATYDDTRVSSVLFYYIPCT